MTAGQSHKRDASERVAGLQPLNWHDWTTPFLFFTGKGGVGKTTIASYGRGQSRGCGAARSSRQHRPGIEPGRRLWRVGRGRPDRRSGRSGLHVLNIDPASGCRRIPRAGRWTLSGSRAAGRAPLHGGAALWGVHRGDRLLRRVHTSGGGSDRFTRSIASSSTPRRPVTPSACSACHEPGAASSIRTATARAASAHSPVYQRSVSDT